MNRFSQGWAAAVVKNRVLVIVFTLLLMVIAPLSFHNLYHDNSNESFFLNNDPHLESYQALIEKFGDPEYLFVGLSPVTRDADVFSPAAIVIIDEITRFLEDHRHVTQVRSLSKYQYTHDSAGMMATDDLFDDPEALIEEPELTVEAREIIKNEVLALGALVTEDLHHTRIIARTVYQPNQNIHKVELVSELREFIREGAYETQGFNLYLTGVPVIGERFESLTQSDMRWINPSMGVLMLIILLIIFRSIFATLVPLAMILSTILIITGIQGLLKWPFTAVNAALIPTTIILTIGSAVHVLVEFFQFRRLGHDPQAAAEATVNDLFFAVLFTCVTTSIGFIALSVTELTPVRQFAILAAIAPLIIFILSMTSLPAVLSFIPWMPRERRSSGDTWVSKLTRAVPGFTFEYRKPIAILGVFISICGLYGVTKLRVDANVANYFKADSRVNRDLLYFNETFKGMGNLEVVIDSGEDGGIKNPQLLKRADALQSWLASFSETGKPNSIIDFYKQINQALNDDQKAFFTLPTTREMAAQFLLLYENTGPEEDLSDLKSFDDRFLRIQVPIVNMDESETTKMLNLLSQGLGEKFSDLNVELTGNLVMSNALNHYVNTGMFRSFSVAILMIGLSFIVLFRSLKYGLVTLIPSIVPVLMTGAIIAYAGISLDLGTMIVGAMTIGIAVDDSIHVMSRYLLQRKRGLSVRKAIESAMHSSGRAVVLTSIILVTGFSVMLFGSFVSYIYIGLFSAMIMSLALVGDLIFMPAILYLLDDNKVSEKGA